MYGPKWCQTPPTLPSRLPLKFAKQTFQREVCTLILQFTEAWISQVWPLGDGFQDFEPQIMILHAEIPLAKSEVFLLESNRFPRYVTVDLYFGDFKYTRQ